MMDRGRAEPGEWYRVDHLPGGVVHIQERFIAPFYRCNIWLIRGSDRDLLFDTGMGVVGLRDTMPELFDKPVLAVASHAHFDHIGSHHEFGDRACHPAEAAVLADPDGHETLADRYAVIDMFDRLPPGGYDQSSYRVRPAPATLHLEAGSLVDLGDRRFEVLHVPGHSPGSIALWEPGTGLLFSGDAVYDGPLVDDVHHSDRAAYQSSLEVLRALDVETVHGGHFPSFGRARFRTIIDDYLQGRRAPGCVCG